MLSLVEEIGFLLEDDLWKQRHGLVGVAMDWLTRGWFAKYLLHDPRPRRKLVPQTDT
jgi:hypothetical protein